MGGLDGYSKALFTMINLRKSLLKKLEFFRPFSILLKYYWFHLLAVRVGSKIKRNIFLGLK